MVVPILVYGGAESWALTKSQLRRLDVFNANCLRSMLGVGRGVGTLSLQELYAITHQPSISDVLASHRLRWLGHVARKTDKHITKQLLFATSPFSASGERVMQRVSLQPAPAWNRLAAASVADAGLAENAWLATCQNRPVWKTVCLNVAAT